MSMPGSRCSLGFAVLVIAFAATACAQAPAASATPAPPTAVGTSALVGKSEGLAIEVKVQGPSAQVTPLQVACVFEYVEGDIFNPPALPAAVNGMMHLDQALHGLVTDLRERRRFAGHALETLLITPPKGTIPAGRLLLIGLGDRNQFTPGLMARVGVVAMREALRLRVESYSFASDLKDAGISSPTRAVAEAVLGGTLEARNTQIYLSTKGAGAKPSVRQFTLLAGPAFFADTSDAARKFLAAQPPPTSR
jgi:hypothetical protein